MTTNELIGQTAGAAVERPGLTMLRQHSWRDFAIYIGFAVVFLLFVLFLHDDGFLRTQNLLNIIRQTAVISVMAVAVTFVIAAAQIDLSVGSVAGLASVIAAQTVSSTGSWTLGALAGLATGAVVGAINGGLVTWLGIPSFLVTLAMLGAGVGLAQWISDFQPIPIVNETFPAIFGSGSVGPIPTLALWVVAALAIGWIAMYRLRFGRRVRATGGNHEAARFSGVNTTLVTFQVMLLSGLTASFAGLLYSGRLQSGRYQWGTGDELSVIAAVVLGGTSLYGGNARVIGSVIGALFVGLINNGLVLAGLDASQQRIAQGIIIIVAVAVGRK